MQTDNILKETMIPKIIHYCWFGEKAIPELEQRCIESWKRLLPDYELRLWNERSFDLNRYPYAREAYEQRKYAFVADVARLWALEQFGGIYMDTDVEVIRPFDAQWTDSAMKQRMATIDCRSLMDLPAFIGYEGSLSGAVGTGIMASAPHGVWVTEQLRNYENRHFVKEDGTLDCTTNAVIISDMMCQQGFQKNGQYGVYKDDLHVFPVDYFCPLSSTRVLHCTANTYCIHHFAGSWQEPSRVERLKNWIFDHILGRKLTDKLVKIKRSLKGRRAVSEE